MDKNYPTVLDRIKSSLIDSIVLIAVIWLVSDTLNSFLTVPNWIKMLLFSLMFLYEPICTTIGGTLGNHKMEIRVRKSSDEEKRINLFQAIVRFILKVIFGWLSFLTIFFSKKSRTIHDIIAGTVMISVAEKQ